MVIISRAARVELVQAVAERYITSSKTDKTRILDEFVRLTGYHRKHAVRVLRGQASATERTCTSRPRLFDEAVQQALVVLWEASDRICGKRLRPLLPLLISSLERHGHLQLEVVIRERLLSVSRWANMLTHAAELGPENGCRRGRNRRFGPGFVL